MIQRADLCLRPNCHNKTSVSVLLTLPLWSPLLMHPSTLSERLGYHTGSCFCSLDQNLGVSQNTPKLEITCKKSKLLPQLEKKYGPGCSVLHFFWHYCCTRGIQQGPHWYLSHRGLRGGEPKNILRNGKMPWISAWPKQCCCQPCALEEFRTFEYIFIIQNRYARQWIILSALLGYLLTSAELMVCMS